MQLRLLYNVNMLHVVSYRQSLDMFYKIPLITL